MDTRWRNNVSLFAMALLLTLGLNGVLSGLSGGSHYMGRSYFASDGIQSELDRFVHYLAFFELKAVTEEEARAQIVVDQHEIEEHRYRYGDLQTQLDNIRMQYQEGLEQSAAEGKAELNEELRAERDAKLEDIRMNFRSDDHVRAKVRKEKEDRLAAFYRELEAWRSEYYEYRERFDYYLVDTETGEVYTDSAVKQDRSNERELLGKKLFVQRYPDANTDRLTIQGVPSVLPHNEEMMRAAAAKPAKHYEGWIAVPKTAAMTARYEEFEQRKWITYAALGAGAVMLAAAIALGRRRLLPALHGAEHWRPAYQRIPVDLRLVLLMATCFITAQLLQEPPIGLELGYMQRNPVGYAWDAVFRLGVLTGLLVASVVQSFFWLRMLREPEKFDEQWQRSLLRLTVRAVVDAFRNRRNGTKVALLFAVAAMFGIGAVVVAAEDDFIAVWLPFYILAGIVLGGYVIRQVGYLNRIMAAAEAFAQGRTADDLPVRRKSALGRLADHLNLMKRGVVVSQAKMATSERLKTELITNVSHDLRTPLTAVISYVELLKKPDLTEEERASYIAVIDQRSKRLKVLIEDLFEAAKMASGSAELNRSRVDLVQLVKQALAESEEKMAASELQFRIKLPVAPVYAIVDGQKMWRVFDNLIGNILRYSLERSRVYITMTVHGDRAEIAFKNIAKYELGDNVDELFERFKRGDASRHTDGSGLGLAIAKSIVDLHGGALELEVDGDLFKATVSLALAT